MAKDLESGTTLSNFNEPRELIVENENESGNVGRSERYFDPWAPKRNSSSEIPGLWPSSVNNEYCCIYRVPSRLRRLNPEAFTPQMLLIGPLQHSRRAEALELSKTDLRNLDYMNMEIHKMKYLRKIAEKYGDQTIEEFKSIIKNNETVIRESYGESTDWINSEEFVVMILHDSVFMLGFFIQIGAQNVNNKGDDILFEEPCLIATILEDLMLLENQLPYNLLEELFEPFFSKLKTEETFRDIILRTFGYDKKINKEVKFRHFTDLFRCVRVETLGLTEKQVSGAKAEPLKTINNMHNADKLDSAGVKFVPENIFSLVISFEGGILKMPCFLAENNTERIMRNLMALEQCHYPRTAYVCNYIAFLDFLIDNEQDVDLLVKKGIVTNWLGHHASVADMVNNLCLGLVDFGSHYYPIAEKLNKHYKSRLNRSVATLRRVYFNDLWTGTATVAGVFLLVLTLIGTVAAVLQLTQTENNPTKSLPPPTKKP